MHKKVVRLLGLSLGQEICQSIILTWK